MNPEIVGNLRSRFHQHGEVAPESTDGNETNAQAGTGSTPCGERSATRRGDEGDTGW